MKGLLTGAVTEVVGYSTRPAEMKYSPDGRPVTNCRVGCGGSGKLKPVFIEVVAWDNAGVKLSEMVDTKGVAIKAKGQLSQQSWRYKGGYYTKLELVYLTELRVQQGNTFVSVNVDKVDEGAGLETVPKSEAKKRGNESK